MDREVIAVVGIGVGFEHGGKARRDTFEPSGSVPIVDESDGLSRHQKPRHPVGEAEAIDAQGACGVMLENDEAGASRLTGGGVGDERKAGRPAAGEAGQPHGCRREQPDVRRPIGMIAVPAVRIEIMGVRSGTCGDHPT